MKRVLISMAVAFTCYLFCLVPAMATEVTLYGDNSYPPYSYLDNGKPAGVYVEIIEKAFAKIDGYEVTFSMVPWKRGIDYVKKGKGVALFPPYFSEDRVPWMLFSEPILPETVVVFGKPEKLEGKIKWPEDFFGSTVAMNSGYNPVSMGTQAFKDAIDAGKIKLDDQGQKNENNLKKLEKGRVDFYITDQMIDISAFKSIVRGIEANKNHGYLGFTKKQDKFSFIPDLKSKFDAVIKEMKASGEIDKIVNSYKK